MGGVLQDFAERAEKWVRRVARLDRGVARRMRREISSAQRELMRLISLYDPSGYSVYTAERLIADIGREMEHLGNVLNAQVQPVIKKAIDLGAQKTAEFAAAEVVGVSAEAALAAREMTMDLVKGVTAEARKRMAFEIRQMVVQQQDLMTTIKNIGRNLTEPSVFKSIADRAETIARTETARAFSLADEAFAARMAAEKAPIFMVWYTAEDERTCEACMALHGQKWRVDDKSRPHQPLHPNCRCTWLYEEG